MWWSVLSLSSKACADNAFIMMIQAMKKTSILRNIIFMKFVLVTAGKYTKKGELPINNYPKG